MSVYARSPKRHGTGRTIKNITTLNIQQEVI